MQVEVSSQVRDFVRALPPEPRRRLRDALRRLEQERGDIKSLEADLAGFHRLRVGRFRVIFWYRTSRGAPVLRCEYAEERSLVYQVFAALARQLSR